MASPNYLAELEQALTKSDWQFIYYATEDRIIKASSLAKEYELKTNADKKVRILNYLNAKAYG